MNDVMAGISPLAALHFWGIVNDDANGAGTGYGYNAWANGGAQQPQQQAPTAAPKPAAPAQPQQPQGATNQAIAQGYNPLQPTYLQTPPQGVATLSGVNTNPQAVLSGVDTSPQAIIAQILQGFAPQAAQAQTGLNQQLAAAGLSGGPALSAQADLSTALAQALAPQLAQATEFGQGQTLQQSLANSGAINNMTGLGLGATLQQSLANAGAMNGMTNQNLRDIIGQQTFNAGAATNAGQDLASMLQQQWLAQLGAFNGVNSMGQSGLNGIASQEAGNFQIPQGGGFNGLGAGLGALMAPQQQAPAQYNPYGSFGMGAGIS